MTRLFIRHKIKDFDNWKKIYDEADDLRKSMGVTRHEVYQLEEDPNDVTAYHDFNTVNEAKAFAGSPGLKEAMKKAGLVGAPDVWFTKPV